MEMNAAALASHVRKEFGKVIVGQEDAVDQLLLVVMTGGHALVEGVPGLAKTLAVKSLAHIFRLQFQRVQCTPDLIPADILGGNIFEPSSATFRLHRGPIFTDLLLVDEINRMPPRTQSALLEAMEEQQVTIDGTSYPLSQSFSVFATQNPVEFEGTYPLPEAQLDRFLMKIRIGYPEASQESEILSRYQGGFEARNLDRAGLEAVPDGSAAGRASRGRSRARGAETFRVHRGDRPRDAQFGGGEPRGKPAGGDRDDAGGQSRGGDGRARFPDSGRCEGHRPADFAAPHDPQAGSRSRGRHAGPGGGGSGGRDRCSQVK